MTDANLSRAAKLTAALEAILEADRDLAAMDAESEEAKSDWMFGNQFVMAESRRIELRTHFWGLAKGHDETIVYRGVAYFANSAGVTTRLADQVDPSADILVLDDLVPFEMVDAELDALGAVPLGALASSYDDWPPSLAAL